MEVVNASYYITVRDGKTGDEVWQVASGHDRSEPGAGYVGRTWPGVVVADVDGDDELEIVTAHEAGYVSVYDRDGYFEPGWPKRPVTSELRGLSVYDLDDDGTMEIIVTAAIYRNYDQWFVYEHTGAMRTGWPQLASGRHNNNPAHRRKRMRGDVINGVLDSWHQPNRDRFKITTVNLHRGDMIHG